jgi:hypothetical protein
MRVPFVLFADRKELCGSLSEKSDFSVVEKDGAIKPFLFGRV